MDSSYFCSFICTFGPTFPGVYAKYRGVCTLFYLGFFPIPPSIQIVVMTEKATRCTVFENLKVFNWHGPLRAEYDYLTLVEFFVDCPSLEIINIDFRNQLWAGFCNIAPLGDEEPDFIELESGAHKPLVGCLYKLKKVEVLNILGYKSEVELLKWLLQKEVILKILSVTFLVPVYAECRSQLLLGYSMPSKTSSALSKEALQENVSLLP